MLRHPSHATKYPRNLISLITAVLSNKMLSTFSGCLAICRSAGGDVSSAAGELSLFARKSASQGRGIPGRRTKIIHPHNSHRPPQATAQATCGPVTPYQHVMGWGRRAGACSPSRAAPGPAQARTYLWPGTDCRNFMRAATRAAGTVGAHVT